MNSKKETSPRIGKRWTEQEDRLVYDAFLRNESISEIAAAQERTYNGIRSRLKRLKLIDENGQAVVPPPDFQPYKRIKKSESAKEDRVISGGVSPQIGRMSQPMHFGKQVHIHLPDGNSKGLKRAELSNWSGQAVAFPRSRFKELASWSELARPGVYFLLATGDGTGERSRAYIGEAEDVYQRLKSHIKSKDFWSEAIAFSSKDDRLTKAHVKYLESRLIQVAADAGRYTLENSVDPNPSSLPRADGDTMEEFIFNLRILMGTLGHRLLEPLAPTIPAGVIAAPSSGDTPGELELTLKYKDLKAKALLTDEGFLVLADSQMATEETESAAVGIKNRRALEIAQDKVDQLNSPWRLKTHVLFSSSSTAVSFLTGSNRNGRIMWFTQKGESLKDWEDQQL